MAQKELLLSKFPRVPEVLSFVLCVGTTAILLGEVGFVKTFGLLVLPCAVYRSTILLANKLADSYAIDKEHKRKMDVMLSALDPSWAFFSAYLTPIIRSILLPIDGYLPLPVQSVAVILAKGVIHGVFLANIDSAFVNIDDNLLARSPQSQAKIWQHEFIRKLVMYTVIQSLAMFTHVFVAGACGRASMLLLSKGKGSDPLEILLQSLTFGALYTMGVHIRMAMMGVSSTALGDPLLMLLIADYIAVTTRTIIDNGLQILLFQPKAVFREYFQIVTDTLNDQFCGV